MIEHELVFLGLLKEGPKHGYEIKKKIKEILSLFAGVNLKSVYYPLRILEKKGLVVKKTTKEGRRPKRFVYALTKKGELRFDELLSFSFLDFKRPEFSIDLSLYFLRFIEPEIARRRLRGRIFILNKVAKEIRELLNSQKKDSEYFYLSSILEHNLKMLETEESFLLGFIDAI